MLFGALSVILGILVALYIIHGLWHKYIVEWGCDPSCKAPLPPGSVGWPIIGETLPLVFQGSAFYTGRFLKYNTRVFKTHIIGSPTIRVYGSDNLKVVLHGENDIVASKWPKTVRRLIGERSLTLSSGDEHLLHRKHVSQAFNHSALSGYIPLIQPIIREEISKWGDRGEILAYPTVRAFVFRIAAVVFCGFDEGDLNVEYLASVFLDFTNGLFTVPLDLPYSTFRKALKAREILLEKLDAKVRKKENISSKEDQRDALRILMDDKESLGDSNTHENICDSLIDILNAGMSTISSAANSLLFHVSQNLQVLKKVRHELRMKGLLNDANSDVTMETLADCKYVTNVIKEVLRLSPPVGGGFRKVLKTFELDGYQIPKGWTLIYSIRDTLQQSPSYFHKENFDPSRFGPGRGEDLAEGRYNFPIFGGGPRSCLGKQYALLVMRIFLIELAKKCDWEVKNPEGIKWAYIPVPAPHNGMPTRFKNIRLEDFASDLDSCVEEDTRTLMNGLSRETD